MVAGNIDLMDFLWIIQVASALKTDKWVKSEKDNHGIWKRLINYDHILLHSGVTTTKNQEANDQGWWGKREKGSF